MFEKVIVSTVNEGKSVIGTFHNVSKIYTDGKHIHISEGVYTWQFPIDSVVSIVII